MTRGTTVDRVILALFPLSVLALGIHQIVTYDVWWQIAAGRWVLEHGWPRTDPFSYGFPDRPWIELRWLWGVGAALLSRAAGLNALIAAKCLLLLATFAALWRLPRTSRGWIVALGLFMALVPMALRLRVRPELASFLFMALTMLALHRFKTGGGGRRIWWLPALQVVWTNTHTLFILGPVLQALLLAGEVVQDRLARTGLPIPRDPCPVTGGRRRTLALVLAASVAACLVNPWGLAGALFPFTLLGEIGSSNILSEAIQEFQGTFALAGLNVFFVGYVAVAVVSAGALVLARRRLALGHVAWWAAFGFLSLLAMRNVALFALVAAAVTMIALDGWADDDAAAGGRRAGRVAVAVRAVAALLAVAVPVTAATDVLWRHLGGAQTFGFGVRTGHFPIRAMAFVAAHDLPRPVIGSLGDGGYLLFEGGSKSVYVDGRLEVYGPEHVETALRALQAGEGFDAVVEAAGVRTAVLRSRLLGPLVARLEGRPDWAPVYFDERHVVYVRIDAETRDLVGRLRVDWSRPVPPDATPPAFAAPRPWLAGLIPKQPDVTPRLDLGDLYRRMGNLDEARRVFREAVALDGGHEGARLMLGLLEEAGGDAARAETLLAGVDPDRLAAPEVLVVRSEAARLAGDLEAAWTWRRRAFDAGADSDADARALARLAIRTERADEARALLDDLVARAPRDVAAWSLRGDLAFRSGRADDARRDYERSLALDPRQPRVHYNVGIVHARAGRLDAARASFEAALRLDPGYTRARQALERLSRTPAP
ncbi:MAG: tetratricopeptide repeat protein [Planctomycetota bacterium]